MLNGAQRIENTGNFAKINNIIITWQVKNGYSFLKQAVNIIKKITIKFLENNVALREN